MAVGVKHSKLVSRAETWLSIQQIDQAVTKTERDFV